LPDASIVIVAEKGDIWIRKFEYDNRGLPVEIKQWLNNKLVGIKRIRYSEK